jgi:phage anti-repressor protein
MNELNQFQSKDGKVVYSARELQAYLGITKDFTDWFKFQVEKCNLIKGNDFVDFSPKLGVNSDIKRKRGRPAKDFALTLSTVLTITARTNQTGTEMTKALAVDVAKRKEPTIEDYARALIARSDENRALVNS